MSALKISKGCAYFFMYFLVVSHLYLYAETIPAKEPVPADEHLNKQSSVQEISQQKRVVEVAVSGLKNVPFKKVWEEIKIRKGRVYSQETIDEDLRRLFDLGVFSSINVDVNDQQEGVKVTFVVVEKPLVTRLDFKGNKVLKAGGLKDEITVKEGEPLDEIKIAESKDKLLTKYREKGYAQVQVETEITDLGEGKRQLTFQVTEGNKIIIESVLVNGGSAFAEKKIRKVLKLKPGKVYKEEVLEKGVQNLRTFYKSRGFYHFEMTEPEVVFNEDHSKVTIKITIAEGSRYCLGTIKFAQNTIFTERELRKDFPIREGRLYHQGNFEQAVANIQALYAEKGYVFSHVEPKVMTHDAHGLMDIDFVIHEGPLVHVGEVEIGGNEITKDYVIEREILLKRGEPLTMSKVRRSQERIFNIGIFEDVNLETRPNAEKPNEQLDLIFSVKEKSQVNMLSLGLGYSSVDRLVGNASVQFVNLFGRGQRINTTLETGSRRTNYEVSFYDPWVLESFYSFGANVFHTRREREYYWTKDISEVLDKETKVTVSSETLTSPTQESDLYEELRDGGGITFGRRLLQNYYTSLGYTYEGVRINTIEDPYTLFETTATSNISQEIINQSARGTLATSSLTLTFSRDTRDNVFDTTKGSRQSISYTVAGGLLQGDNNFQKAILDMSWFFPSFWKFVFGIHTMLGMVNTYGGAAEVPVYERFYLGGAETVRGYEYRGQVGVIEGGKFATLLNLEYTFPIIREKRQTILKGAFFFDAGSTWATTKISYGDFHLKRGVGFGLRFAIPQFPIRLDWGYGLDHKEEESNSQFYFTLGSLF